MHFVARVVSKQSLFKEKWHVFLITEEMDVNLNDRQVAKMSTVVSIHGVNVEFPFKPYKVSENEWLIFSQSLD